MSGNPSSYAQNFSKSGAQVTGVSQELFPEVPYNGMEERWITNPSASATLWVNLFGGTAQANTEGSFGISPGGAWSGKVAGIINVIGTAGQPITAGQR